MARYAVIADLARQASWDALAAAAGKGDLLDPAGELIDADALRAAVDAGLGDRTAVQTRVVARLERALEDGCALVDACLLARYPDYAQPVRDASEPPTPVTVWTVDLALERLLGQGEGDEWRHRGDLARARLDAIAAGDLDLFGDGEGDEDDGAGVRRGAPDEVFSRASLAEFGGWT